MADDHPILLLWTAPTLEEARRVVRHLLERRFVACATLIPGVESHYHWQGKVESSQEIQVLLKSHAIMQQQIEEEIRTQATYELPELLVLPITGGSPAYLGWLKESLHRSK